MASNSVEGLMREILKRARRIIMQKRVNVSSISVLINYYCIR